MMEPVPVLVLLQRQDAGAAQPLLEQLGRSGLFEARLAEDPSRLADLPPGSLALALAEPGAGTQIQGLVGDHLERGGRLLALGDSLAAWPEVAARIGWEIGPLAPATELLLRPRPDHPLTARLDPELRLRDRLRLARGTPEGAQVLFEVPWQYGSQPAGFELAVGRGRLLHLGLGIEAAALTDPLLQRLAYRGLRHLAGVEPGSPLRAGLIGYGAIGREHALSLSSVDGFELRAACDVSAVRRQQAAAEFQVALHERSEGLLADPDIDLVVVGTPPNAHTEMVVSALEAGKHVVCEKPFALSAADCDRMLAAAERAGRLLTVYQSRRWDSDFVAMRDAVAAGSIGEPFYMEAFIGGFSHPCSYWHSHEPISGGTIFDWGSHYFDWVLQLFGQPVASVTAQQHKRVWHDVTNADQVRVDLLFEGGAQASFLQSDIAAALKPKWYLLGTAGALLGEWRLEKVSSRAWTGDLVEETLAPSEAPARVFVQRPGPDGGSGREELALPRRIENGFYRNLGDHLLAGEALAVTAAQARRTVAVMEAATRSIAEGGRQVEAAF
jgi:predicted dehydrogenase